MHEHYILLGPAHDTASILEDIKTIQQKYDVLDISDDIVSAIIGDGIKRPFPSELETAAKVARKSIVLAVDKKAEGMLYMRAIWCVNGPEQESLLNICMVSTIG